MPQTARIWRPTPLIVAEVDHLALPVGRDAQREFRNDLVAGAYRIGSGEGAAGTVVVIAETYRELGVSLADTSLVWLASLLDTAKIATFDERHFRVMTPQGDAPDFFTVLPADA